MTEKNDEYKNVIPVFQLKPQSSSRVKCTLRGYSNNEERLFDDQLDVETTEELKEKIGENTTLLGTANNYIVIGKYCRCNIPGEYLIKNNNLPVYYLSVIYTKPLITGCLYNVFLYFELNNDTIKKLDNPSKYYRAFMDGKYYLQVVPTDDDFIHKLREMVEDDILLQNKEKYDNSNDEDKEKIMDDVMLTVEKKMELYKNFFDKKYLDIDSVPTQKKVFNMLDNICKGQVFQDLLSYGLLIRENDRIADRGDIDVMEYNIPENIIDLKKIKENPEILENMIGNNNDCDDDF